MRFDIDDYKAFTSVNKMYALANVWMKSELGWGDLLKIKIKLKNLKLKKLKK